MLWTRFNRHAHAAQKPRHATQILEWVTSVCFIYILKSIECLHILHKSWNADFYNKRKSLLSIRILHFYDWMFCCTINCMSTLLSVICILQIDRFKQYTLVCIVHYVVCIVHHLVYIVRIIHYIMCIVHYKVFFVQYIVSTVQYILVYMLQGNKGERGPTGVSGVATV